MKKCDVNNDFKKIYTYLRPILRECRLDGNRFGSPAVDYATHVIKGSAYTILTLGYGGTFQQTGLSQS
jgi:hypothetical protein